MTVQINHVLKSLSLVATDESLTDLCDLKGQWVVLYFYPKDNTSGCTQEALDFIQSQKKFQRLGAVILGVSRDSVKSHQNFIDKLGITFSLISDTDEKLCEYFSVMKEKSMYGRKYMGIERSTFLIDSTGILRQVWRKVTVSGHVEEVLQALQVLQKSVEV